MEGGRGVLPPQICRGNRSSIISRTHLTRFHWGEGQTRDVCISSLQDEKGSFHIEASMRTMMKEPF
jgi:hypothetical protein